MLRVVDQIAMLVCGIPPIRVVGVLAPPILAHFGSFGILSLVRVGVCWMVWLVLTVESKSERLV
jgi:hypothetical protein